MYSFRNIRNLLDNAVKLSKIARHGYCRRKIEREKEKDKIYNFILIISIT